MIQLESMADNKRKCVEMREREKGGIKVEMINRDGKSVRKGMLGEDRNSTPVIRYQVSVMEYLLT